jgi:hypothetical protein
VRDTQGKILARCKLLISFSEHSFIFATNNHRHFCPGSFTEYNSLSLNCCGLMTQHPLDQRLEQYRASTSPGGRRRRYLALHRRPQATLVELVEDLGP